MKNNGDIIKFVKTKDYVMVNNNLGKGSFGKTVVIQDPFIKELFVAKKYEPEYEEIKEQFFSNFLNEIKILYKLNHKNIVRIFNYFPYESKYTGYIIMEYIDGIDIGTFIKEYCEPLEKVTLNEVFLQLIDAFEYIESHGIIHRDIREGNILIDSNGTVKVIDFGIGKIIEKFDDGNDSLISQINRDCSDTLPQEYYEGIYTSQTDMFYLAELLNRLTEKKKSEDNLGFSYKEILNKMMQRNPQKRFESFAEVKQTIERHEFTKIDISEHDKKIYQSFTGLLYQSLITFIDNRKFNNDSEAFISKLEKTLNNNIFEENINNNSDLISSLVISNYKYNPQIKIPCKKIHDFLNWFKKATYESQSLIMNNIISKLSSKPIEYTDDYPF